MSTSPEHVKCLIIGSGPAGFSAAIYAARADMKPLMIEGPLPGGRYTDHGSGQLPWIPGGPQWSEMMNDLREQALRFRTVMRNGWVTKVDLTGPVHKVWVDEKTEMHADTVIISTGASAKWLGLPNEIRLRDIGGGVTACAVCDGFFYKGQNVVLVGAGDSACEEATYLAKLCPKVYMLVRKGEFRASKAMVHRVENTPNIEVLFHTEVKDVLGEHAVDGVLTVNNKTGEERKLDVTGLFIAIGHTPATEIFQRLAGYGRGRVLEARCGSPAPRSRACSWPVMLRTRSIAKLSRAPVADAWRPWMRSDGWPRKGSIESVLDRPMIRQPL